MLELKNFAEAFSMPDAAGKLTPGKTLAQPAITSLIGAAAITYRSVPKAAEGVLAIAEEEAARRLEWRIANDISELLKGHAAIYGPRGEPSADNSKWDADVEESLEDYAAGAIRDGIGQDGIGEAMNRLDLNMPEWGKELVGIFVRGAVHGLTREKTPAKVLSSIGIVKSDLEALVTAADDDISDVGKTQLTTSQAMFEVISALRKFAESMGATDTETLAAFCGGWEHIHEQLWAREPALRASALTALDAIPQAAALEVVVNSGASATDVFAAVFSSDPAPVDAKPAGRKKRAAKDVPVGKWNDIAADLRALLPGKDDKKAEALGMSRSAFGNFATGKKGWQADQAEYEATLAMIDQAAAGLASLRATVADNVPF